MSLKPFRVLPNSLAEWARWCKDQSVHPEDLGTFTGVVTGSNILRGSGSPEGVVSATPGALYTNTSGGASTTLYVKESGTGAFGWVAK